MNPKIIASIGFGYEYDLNFINLINVNPIISVDYLTFIGGDILLDITNRDKNILKDLDMLIDNFTLIYNPEIKEYTHLLNKKDLFYENYKYKYITPDVRQCLIYIIDTLIKYFGIKHTYNKIIRNFSTSNPIFINNIPDTYIQRNYLKNIALIINNANDVNIYDEIRNYLQK